MVQTFLYAKQLADNGLSPDEIALMLPYQGRSQNISFDKGDLQSNFANIQKAVKIAQGITEGTLSTQSFLDIARNVRQVMFGENISNIADQYVERTKWSEGSHAFNPGVISDALMLHDKYNEALKTEEEINKFISQKTRSRNSSYGAREMWLGQYNKVGDIKAQADIERASHNEAQANDLEARYWKTANALESGLFTAALNDEIYTRSY